jgi:N-formylmaleamate deformylase
MVAHATTETMTLRELRHVQSRWFSSGPLALRALDFSGEGKPIVILPGITSTAVTWTFVVEALNSNRWFLVLDMRGRGVSDKPERGYSTVDYVGDLRNLIDILRLEKPILVGHSMGARVVAAFDAEFPGIARALVAIEPPMSGPGRRPYPTPLEFFLNQRCQILAGATAEDIAKLAPTWNEARIRDRIEWLPTCSEAAIRQSYAAFHSEDFLGSWTKVTARALFLRGAESPVIDASEFIEIQLTNKRAEYGEIASSGHMIPWDNLAGFCDALNAFLEQIDPLSAIRR